MCSVPPSTSSGLNSALPPIVWFQGSQSSRKGSGSCGPRGRHCIIIAALAHIIRCVLITALGMPVEPEVNSSLPTVSGPIASTLACTAGVARVAASAAYGRLGTPAGGRSTCTTCTPSRSSAASARSKGGPSCTITSPGFTRSKM